MNIVYLFFSLQITFWMETPSTLIIKIYFSVLAWQIIDILLLCCTVMIITMYINFVNVNIVIASIIIIIIGVIVHYSCNINGITTFVIVGMVSLLPLILSITVVCSIVVIAFFSCIVF